MRALLCAVVVGCGGESSIWVQPVSTSTEVGTLRASAGASVDLRRGRTITTFDDTGKAFNTTLSLDAVDGTVLGGGDRVEILGDGSVQRIDRTGAARWKHTWKRSEVAASIVEQHAFEGEAVLIRAVASSGTLDASSSGVALLLLDGNGGTVWATAAPTSDESAVYFANTGVLVADRVGDRLRLTGYDSTGKPRMTKQWTGTVADVARCPSKTMVSATITDEDVTGASGAKSLLPRILELADDGSIVHSSTSPGTGAKIGCDAKGVVAVNGSTLTTYALDLTSSNPRVYDEIASFASVRVAGDYLFVHGTAGRTYVVGKSSVNRQSFVARIYR